MFLAFFEKLFSSPSRPRLAHDRALCLFFRLPGPLIGPLLAAALSRTPPLRRPELGGQLRGRLLPAAKLRGQPRVPKSIVMPIMLIIMTSL